MASDSITDEPLDFEEDTLQQEDEFYCAICSECFDEPKEFIDHTQSNGHISQCNVKHSSLSEKDPYCSICLIKVEPSFEQHCSDSDHIQFLDSLRRSMPDTQMPVLKYADSCDQNHAVNFKKPPAKPVGALKKGITNKLIGLRYIKKSPEDGQWVCNICLEKFVSVISHCSKAMHAIQRIKMCDPELAYKIKVSANQKGKKKIASTLISSKVEEIYEQEKDTPEYLKTLQEIEELTPKDNVVQNPNIGNTEITKIPCTKPSTSAEPNTSPALVPALVPSEPEKDPVSSPQDVGEMVSLFEEDDRSFIPMNDDVNVDPKPAKKRSPSKNATMIIGLCHLKLRGRLYYCSLCDITCKTTLESCKLHVTSSLHRRRTINKFSAHPIPNYLEQLRTQNCALYNRLIEIESMKIEVDERKDENTDEQTTRAGVLGLKDYELLPEPLLNVKGLPKGCEDLMDLAKKWDAENNVNMFKKTSKEPSNSGANKSAITPIQPHIENILVGVKTVTHIKNGEFHCGLCNIKFDVKYKKTVKNHVNGRLHKKKALVAAYGADVESFLAYRSKKDGYEMLNKIINQACVPLEKEEIESEPPTSREIRAKLLGVKVEQLPLPMIIMYGNTEALDIKQAICDWKGGKSKASSSAKVMPKTSVSPVPDPVAKVEKPPLKQQKPTDEGLKVTVKFDSSEQKIKNHLDSQTFDQKPASSINVAEPVKTSGARNIFELCKPMPDASPDKPIFKNTASARIKNIDIDGLRKSLVDAELGEFVPVAKATPDKSEPKKRTPSDETPKSSKSEDMKKRRLSGEKSEEQKAGSNTKENNSITTQQPSQSTNVPSRNTYGNTIRKTYGNVTKKEESNTPRSAPPTQAGPPTRNSHSGPIQANQRGIGRGNQPKRPTTKFSGQVDDKNKQRDSNNQRDSGRINRGNNNFRNNSNNNNSFKEQRPNFRDSNNHDRFSQNQGSSIRRSFTNDRNTDGQSAGGNVKSNFPSQTSQRPQFNKGRPNNNPSQEHHRFGKTDGNNMGRGNSYDGPRNRQQPYNNQLNSWSNSSQQSDQQGGGSQIQNTTGFAKNFDVDLASMRNSGLSSALSKITNISPISQACSAKISEAVSNMFSNNKQMDNSRNSGFQGHGHQSQGHSFHQNNNQGFREHQGKRSQQYHSFGSGSYGAGGGGHGNGNNGGSGYGGGHGNGNGGNYGGGDGGRNFNQYNQQNDRRSFDMDRKREVNNPPPEYGFNQKRHRYNNQW